MPLIACACAHTQIIYYIHRHKIGRKLHLLQPAAFIVLLFTVKRKKRREREQKNQKKPSLLVFRIGWCKGEHTICLQSPYDAPPPKKKNRLRLPFQQHPPSQCRQITGEGGRQRLKARTINFPGESVHSAWRARVTFR